MALLALLATISTINVSAASLSPSDSRKLSGVDPRTTFPGHPKSKYRLLVGNSSPELTTVSDPGWRDPKTSDYTVLRTSDPTNGGKKAFRHRVKKGMTYRQDSGYQSGRAEAHTNWGSSSNAVPGVPYWAVYAFYVDADHPFNGSGDDLDILEIGHPVTSKNSMPSPAFYLRRNGTMDAMVSSNTVLNGTTATRRTTKVFSKAVQKKVWHYIVVQFKLDWDVAKKPYFRVWHAVGNGAPVQLCNTSIANAYRESAGYIPQKFGLYQWNVNSWGSSITRTLYTKGLHVFRDQSGSPALSVNTMLEYIRAI
jgi:hypothetical protein